MTRILAITILLLAASGFAAEPNAARKVREDKAQGRAGGLGVANPAPARSLLMRVTAYCNCKKCTGKSPGDKGYGITASGNRASLRTVAADRRVLRMGSRVSILGVGERIVEDTGAAIKGNRLDLWFPTHAQAKAWGVKMLRVEIVKEQMR